MAARKKKTESTAHSEPSFEVQLERLEEIVQSLEGGDLPLSKSLALFEEGISLARKCEASLSQAEMTIEALMRSESGERIEALDPDDFES